MKDYSSETKATVSILKNLISQKGYDYIYDNAHSVYKALLKKGIERRIADVTLYALVSETARDNKTNIREEVENKLFLNEEMTTVVSNMFSTLYDTKSLSKMKKEEFKGLEEFLKGEWEIKSSGEATWEYRRSTRTDYSYTYKMTIKVVDRALVEKDLKDKLRENPFLKAEDIRSYYENEIDGIICGEFEDYCTCDDYYPPVVEDFPGNIYYEMDKFLPEHGLERIDDDYDYHEGDFY